MTCATIVVGWIEYAIHVMPASHKQGSWVCGCRLSAIDSRIIIITNVSLSQRRAAKAPRRAILSHTRLYYYNSLPHVRFKHTPGSVDQSRSWFQPDPHNPRRTYLSGSMLALRPRGRGAARLLLLLIMALCCCYLPVVQAFVVPNGPCSMPGRSRSSRRQAAASTMVADLFSLFGNGEPQGIPRSIKDGVNALRFATQRAVRACFDLIYTVFERSALHIDPNIHTVHTYIAQHTHASSPILTLLARFFSHLYFLQLRDRTSRMEVNLPRGVPLAVEAPNVDPDGDKYEKSDRELARLVVELFKPIIESTVVVRFVNFMERAASKDVDTTRPHPGIGMTSSSSFNNNHAMLRCSETSGRRARLPTFGACTVLVDCTRHKKYAHAQKQYALILSPFEFLQGHSAG